jgi:hypothetical protein
MEATNARPCADGCGRSAVGRYALYCRQCRAGHRIKPSKYTPTPEIDALIAKAWQTGHGSGAGLYVSRKTGWPVWKVKRRAVALGVARNVPKESLWSKAEMECLEEHAWMSPEGIQRKIAKLCGTTRTLVAIVLKRKRLKIAGSRSGGYTTGDLVRLFGVDRNKVLNRWIKFGWLKTDTSGAFNRADHKAVYNFVLSHPEEIDLGRVDRLWFLDLVTKGKIGAGVGE